MLRAYKYRIYPNEEQCVLIEKHFGCVRLLYNLGLTYRERAWENRVSVGYNECSAELTELKKEYPFLKEVNSQSLQSSLKNLDASYKGFFKKQSRYPSFKSKIGKQSFSCPQHTTVDFKDKLLYLPKFKSGIPIVIHRAFKGDSKTIAISKTPTGKYFASVLVETGVELPAKKTPAIKRAIGIDVGLKDFATIGDVNLSKVIKIDNPKYLRLDTEVLKRRRRQLARKVKGSNNREKARLKLARKHEKIANKNKDFLHKISYSLTSDNQVGVICIEDLNVKGMMANHKLARAIGEVSWSEFFRQLKYKSDWNGKLVLEAGRFSATSKDCHVCGCKNNSLLLLDREWACSDCGAIHDRDGNAVVNIISSAFEKYKNRDGLPELTLGESSPLSSRKKTKGKERTVSQEKFRSKSVLLAA